MSLYDRDYKQGAIGGKDHEEYAAYDEGKLKAFVKQTYQLFAASMLAGAVGAYIGVGIAPVIQSGYWLFFILMFGLFVGLNFVKEKPNLALFMLFAATFISGLSIGPMLALFLNMPGGSSIITNAFLLTAVLFGGLSYYAMSSDYDFAAWGKPMMIAFWIVFAFALINLFFLQSPLGAVLISSAVALLMCGFILYDTQNIIKGRYDSPITAAASLYLDFFNLFISLLQILGFMSNSDD